MHTWFVMKKWARFLVPVFFVVLCVAMPLHSAYAFDLGTWLGDGFLATILVAVANVLTIITGAIGSLILVVIDMLVIPILNYNSFSTSTVIGLGWSLVRDAVNMFVIIVLIAIAIRTILGMHGAHWQQQIPQLFIAVVMVNFSRTICGLAIDISQVIMFTFVNALLDIAAGNFAQLFQLPSFGKFSASALQQVSGNGESLSTAATSLAGAFLQIPLYGSILAVMFLLAGAFLWRIVILWILVILSPLAFFLQGVKGIIPVEGAGDWMGKFTAALVMGPLLTFFLWLALAAASSGSIAESENFPLPVDSKSYNLSLEVFDSSHLTSIVLALILLIVGMQQAGQYSSKLDGFAKSLINEDMGRKVVAFSGKAPFMAGAYAGRRLDRYGAGIADKALGNTNSLSMRESLAKTGFTKGKAMAKEGGLPGFLAGRALMSGAGALEMQAEHLVEGDLKAAQETVKNMGDDQKIAQYELIARGQESWKMGIKDEYNVLAADLVTSAKMQKKTRDHLEDHHYEEALKNYTAQGVPLGDAKKLAKREAEQHASAEFDTLMQNAISTVDAKKNLLLDDSGKQKLNEAKSKYLHLLRDEDGNAEKGIRKFVKSNDFNASKMSDDAVSNSVVQTVLGGEQDRNTREKITYLQRVRDEKYAARISADVKTVDADVIAGSTAGAGRVHDIMNSSAQVNINELGDSAVLAETTPAGKAKVKNDIGQAFFNAAKGESADVIVKGINNGSVDLGRLTNADVDMTTASGRNMATAIFESKIGESPEQFSARVSNPAAMDAIAEAANNVRTTGGVPLKNVASVEARLIRSGRRVDDVVREGMVLDPAAQTIPQKAQAKIKQIIEKDPGVIAHFERGIPAPAPGARPIPNHATAIVHSTLSEGVIKNMANSAIDAKDPTVRDEMKKAIEVSMRAAQAELDLYNGSNPPPPPGTKDAYARQRQKLIDLADAAEAAHNSLL